MNTIETTNQRKKEVQFLIDVLRVQTTSYNTKKMNRFVKKFCLENNIGFTIEEGNIYITKGDADIYPCTHRHRA